MDTDESGPESVLLCSYCYDQAMKGPNAMAEAPKLSLAAEDEDYVVLGGLVVHVTIPAVLRPHFHNITFGTMVL